MTLVEYSDIPVWLHESDFYRSLNGDEPDNLVEIPNECFRATNLVETVEDAADVVRVISFWGVKCIPQSLLDFCFTNKFELWDRVVAEVVGEGIEEHKHLSMAFKDPKSFSLETALSIKRPEFVTFWLSKNGPTSEHSKNAIAQACRFGQLDLVRTLHERGFPRDSSAYWAAAQYGHIRVLEYLHSNGLPICSSALKFAARGGQLECMKYLLSIGCEWDDCVTSEFAVPAHYECLNSPEQVKDDITWTDDFTIAPPAGGYLQCLRYALKHGCPIGLQASCRACTYKLLDCLQLLDQYQSPWNATTACAAASAGALECLQYLHQHGCRWNETVTQAAAQSGQ